MPSQGNPTLSERQATVVSVDSVDCPLPSFLRGCRLNQGVLQGTVFERVIQEVCDASQVDFEESGVDQQTLVDLRKVRDLFLFFKMMESDETP